jgi:hypothetical protein
VKGPFRRGANRGDDHRDERVQRRLNELADQPERRPSPEADTQVAEPAEPEADAPEDDDVPPPPVGEAEVAPNTWRRRARRIVLASLFVVMVLVVGHEISTYGPQGWTSKADPGHPLASWPVAPAGFGPTPLAQPPTDVPDADTYAFMTTQKGSDEPVTYDPCAPIHYVVNDRRAFGGAEKQLAAAVAEVEKATGLTFVDDGATKEAPVGNRAYQDEYYGKSWSPVLVAWSDSREYGALKHTLALGGSRLISTGGRRWFVTGSITLNGPQLAEVYRESDGPAKVRTRIMRELGHLVGLDDVTASGEIMNPATGLDAAGWGPGDLAGLARLGAGPCIAY